MRIVTLFSLLSINAIQLALISTVLLNITMILIGEMHDIPLLFLMVMAIPEILLLFLIIWIASIFIYSPLARYVTNTQLKGYDLFKKYLPLFVLIFPVSGTILFSLSNALDTLTIAIIINAYFTSVIGWYKLSQQLTDEKLKIEYI